MSPTLLPLLWTAIALMGVSVTETQSTEEGLEFGLEQFHLLLDTNSFPSQLYLGEQFQLTELKRTERTFYHGLGRKKVEVNVYSVRGTVNNARHSNVALTLTASSVSGLVWFDETRWTLATANSTVKATVVNSADGDDLDFDHVNTEQALGAIPWVQATAPKYLSTIATPSCGIFVDVHYSFFQHWKGDATTPQEQIDRVAAKVLGTVDAASALLSENVGVAVQVIGMNFMDEGVLTLVDDVETAGQILRSYSTYLAKGAQASTGQAKRVRGRKHPTSQEVCLNFLMAHQSMKRVVGVAHLSSPQPGVFGGACETMLGKGDGNNYRALNTLLITTKTSSNSVSDWISYIGTAHEIGELFTTLRLFCMLLLLISYEFLFFFLGRAYIWCNTHLQERTAMRRVGRNRMQSTRRGWWTLSYVPKNHT
eukprot:m.65071 g.65071  ORF g.65071 m.65071 type:complete len:424 (-) comp12044_c0_seq2:456-1727(-)